VEWSWLRPPTSSRPLGVAAPHSYLPVLVLTGDSSQQARRRALSKGAKDFVTKPFEVDEVLLRIRNLLETKYLHRAIATENIQLERRVKERTADLESAHLDTLERLAVAAEFRDDDTGKHTERVAAISAILGGEAGLRGEEVDLLRRAAPLHDLGKIGIPDAILRKPGALTPDEWEIMKTHTTAGARILGEESLGSSAWPRRSRCPITSAGTAVAIPRGVAGRRFRRPRGWSRSPTCSMPSPPTGSTGRHGRPATSWRTSRATRRLTSIRRW
jgi:CheY-like chemotaxis protein